ncbi:MAG: hypothetical protein KGI83_07140 [Verrucomicrobiota bacterium]|nr:hypothetical protein [Verrucomicrobiota bacterium]
MAERAVQVLRNPSVVLSKVASIAIPTLIFLDLWGLSPCTKEYRIAADSLLLLASALGSLGALWEGTSRIASLAQARELTGSEKLKRCVSGALLMGIGGLSLWNSCYNAFHLYQGAQLFDSLSASDQEGVLKYRSIHQLSQTKDANAVIFDGISSEWGWGEDDASHPVGEFPYAYAKTRFYRVNSTNAFCGALKDAYEHFGEQIENVLIMGHGNYAGIKLNRNYAFYPPFYDASPCAWWPFKCLTDYVKERGHILLLSCNSATQYESSSLAQNVASCLPAFRVSGIAAYFNPVFSSYWFDPVTRALHVNSHFPLDLHWNLVFPWNTVTYDPT